MEVLNNLLELYHSSVFDIFSDSESNLAIDRMVEDQKAKYHEIKNSNRHHLVAGASSIFTKVAPRTTEKRTLDPLVRYAVAEEKKHHTTSSTSITGSLSLSPDTAEEWQQKKDDVDKQDTLLDGKISIKTPQWFQDWAYSKENALWPLFDTCLFMFDIIPLMLMCYITSQTVYAEYDEITMELECMNKAFQGFRLLWHDNGRPVDRFLDFSE